MKEGLIPPGGPRSVCGWVLSDREGVNRQKTRIRDVCPTRWNEKSVCVWLMDRAPCNSTLQHETGGSEEPGLAISDFALQRPKGRGIPFPMERNNNIIILI